MIIKNKRGQIVQSSVMWFFATFFYFIFGYDLISLVVQDIFLSNNTGLIYYFGAIIPFIPIFALMFWGYTILTPEPVTTGGFGE